MLYRYGRRRGQPSTDLLPARPFFVPEAGRPPHPTNIAIIAHVDHGRDDARRLPAETIRAPSRHTGPASASWTRVTSRRERGITILAKDCAIEVRRRGITLSDTHLDVLTLAAG